MATKLEKGIDWGTKVEGRTVAYAFSPGGEMTHTVAGWVRSATFSSYEKGQFKAAFKAFSSFTKLKFKQVKDAADADFVLTGYKAEGSLLGAMGPPGYGWSAGSGAFNRTGYGWQEGKAGYGALEVGGYGYITIIHELGHGLGLAHPHDTGGGSSIFPGVGASDDLGRYHLNQGIYTMMSYNDGWQTNPDGGTADDAYGYEGTPMALDIAVLQKKYGANESYHKGDDVYRLPDVNKTGTFYACIWDAGGRDAIVARGGADATIDLRAATLKAKPGGGGYVSHIADVFGGFTIAHRVKIEDARGAGGDDAITGNKVANQLRGGTGDDRIHGGRGDDVVKGGAGDDWLIGGKGDDLLRPGGGGGTLTGGPGADTFRFDAAPKDGTMVAITDFGPGKDLIALALDAFSGLAKGRLAASAFAEGAAALDGLDRILYDPGTGFIRYDRDGTGARDPIAFAKVDPGLGIDHKDFLVVA